MKKIKFSVLFAAALLISCNKNVNVKTSTEDSAFIRIKGSESELNLIEFFARQYSATGNTARFLIEGGGSSTGLQALIDNKVDIAISSRSITQDEINQAKKNGIEPVQTIVALDAVAIIMNPKTALDSLSLFQLSKIFSGETKNWNELSAPKATVTVCARDENSGTHHYILNRLNIRSYTSGAKKFAENKKIIEYVATHPGSIGYVSLGSIVDPSGKPLDNIWPVSIYIEGGKPHSPHDKESIISGDYPLVRPLFQYTGGYSKRAALDFINFELAGEQQDKLQDHGYFPIYPMHKMINVKNRYILK